MAQEVALWITLFRDKECPNLLCTLMASVWVMKRALLRHDDNRITGRERILMHNHQLQFNKQATPAATLGLQHRRGADCTSSNHSLHSLQLSSGTTCQHDWTERELT